MSIRGTVKFQVCIFRLDQVPLFIPTGFSYTSFVIRCNTTDCEVLGWLLIVNC